MKAAIKLYDNNSDLMGRLENNQLQSIKSLCNILLRELEILTTNKLENKESIHESISLIAEVERFETNIIKNALNSFRGNQTQAARFLGLKLSTLNAKIKRYKINPTEFI